MQESHPFFLDTSYSLTEAEITTLDFSLQSGDRIFLIGDLGSGKSTLVRSLLRSYFSDPDLVVRSPTYTYYQKYGDSIYHFDLYRVENFEDLALIGADDIFNNTESICIIEWPEILGESIKPTKKITISQDHEKRRYTIQCFP